jgi:glutaconyl-CoA/methylmalonyl-CoA decarboxylase subunit delta
MSDLEFGLRITVAGMGIVFGVLVLLWGLLTLALRFERRAEAGTARGDASAPDGRVRIDGAAAMDPALVAAITVAVLHHAEARRLQAAPVMRSYWPGSLLFASRWVSAGRTRQGQSWRRSRR